MSHLGMYLETTGDAPYETSYPLVNSSLNVGPLIDALHKFAAPRTQHPASPHHLSWLTLCRCECQIPTSGMLLCPVDLIRQAYAL